MAEETSTIIFSLAILVLFLSYITGLKYVIENHFVRTRLIMTSFLVFVVITLTASFWRYTLDSLPFTVPALAVGAFIGYVIGVRAERAKLDAVGIQYYLEHFAHIHVSDLKALSWWSIINFYSVMGGLVLINLVGLSTVIFAGRESLAIATCAVGAFLVGTLVPYIVHLWSVKATVLTERQ